MRAYRESFSEPGRRRGLSQDELLRRMAAVDDSYSRRFSHATVTRWEAGTTRPNVERLRVFGKALNLSESEVSGLMLLAGLAPDLQAADPEAQFSVSDSEPVAVPGADPQMADPPESSSATGGTEPAPALWSDVLRFQALRTLLPALYTVVLGYGLSALGWDDDWMPLAYVMITSLLVLIQAFVGSNRRQGLHNLYWASMFILLVFPALRFAPLGLDHYGFYRVGDLSGTHLPYMLTLLVGVGLAGLSALAFQLLSAWQSSASRAERSPLVRAVWVTIPSTLLSYVVVVVLSGTTVWIQSTVAMPILVLTIIAMQVINDPGTRPDQNQCRFLLQATFLIVILASTLGAVTIVLVYGSPDLPMALPDHNLLGSWEIDPARLGYTQEQLREYLDIGYLWHSMALFAYMVAVVAGSLLVAVYRLAGGAGEGENAARSHRRASPAVSSGRANSEPRWSPDAGNASTATGGR